MKKFSLFVLIFTFFLEVPYAFSTWKDNLGIGLNIGAQRIYGDGSRDPGIDIGGEGLANYFIRKNQFGLMTGLGVSWLKSYDNRRQPITTNLITLDIKGAYWPLPYQTVNPYGYAGLGIINFSYPLSDNERYVDGAFILGGGIEWMINQQMSFNTTLDYRWTTGDDFDGAGQNDGSLNFNILENDGYLNMRIGFTYYFVPRNVTRAYDQELAEFDSSFQAGLDEFEDENDSAYATDEFVILKSRIEEMNDRITEKEAEISELKTMIGSRKEKLEQLEKEGPRPRPPAPTLAPPGGQIAAQTFGENDDFQANYQVGLEKFYAHDYDGTISVMSGLLQLNSQHRLSSNCQYWIGEALYGKREYQNAIGAFEAVLGFANSPKLDDALLMLGKCHLNIGDAETAKKYFSQLLQEYPESEYIQRAEGYLANL